MPEQDWNTGIIEEFRANEGKVGGPFEGRPLLLLTHTGAKTGTRRTNPLVYMRDGDDYVVFASKGGAPTNPDWYHNPSRTPRPRSRSAPRRSRCAHASRPAPSATTYGAMWSTLMPGFGDYEEKTTRTIPVIVLEPWGERAEG